MSSAETKDIDRALKEYETNRVLEIRSIDDPRWFNISKYQQLVILDCRGMMLFKLPDNLPRMIQNLCCLDNLLTSLPDNLPSSLQNLCCRGNQLTMLPNNLPSSLLVLDCQYNRLTSLP